MSATVKEDKIAVQLLLQITEDLARFPTENRLVMLKDLHKQTDQRITFLPDPVQNMNQPWLHQEGQMNLLKRRQLPIEQEAHFQDLITPEAGFHQIRHLF